MAMIDLTIQIDNELKERAELYFQDLGIDMSFAFNLFVRDTLKKGSFPIETFNIEAVSDDEYFHNHANIEALKRSIKQFEKGKIITKTIEELRAFEQ